MCAQHLSWLVRGLLIVSLSTIGFAWNLPPIDLLEVERAEYGLSARDHAHFSRLDLVDHETFLWGGMPIILVECERFMGLTRVIRDRSPRRQIRPGQLYGFYAGRGREHYFSGADLPHVKVYPVQ